MCKTGFGKWWYDRSVRDGIYIFGTLMLAVGMFKPIIPLFLNDGEAVYAVIDGIMLMLLVFSSAVVGAFFGIDFKKHDDEKRQNKTKSGK